MLAFASAVTSCLLKAAAHAAAMLAGVAILLSMAVGALMGMNDMPGSVLQRDAVFGAPWVYVTPDLKEHRMVHCSDVARSRSCSETTNGEVRIVWTGAASDPRDVVVTHRDLVQEVSCSKGFLNTGELECKRP